ncbi:hypothetical protein A3863_24195 [Priestia endophytica]|uniref:Uncharacterized protein n=1 Tax=Priestia endophytica TaxID=135735 RepID=A0AAX1QDL4_9BACI|nr:hypothetical protein A3864_07415 [Priestia endophytica]RAS84306.1 hypothetical protein A3863_24195 [Priestia endophytica]
MNRGFSVGHLNINVIGKRIGAFEKVFIVYSKEKFLFVFCNFLNIECVEIGRDLTCCREENKKPRLLRVGGIFHLYYEE